VGGRRVPAQASAIERGLSGSDPALILILGGRAESSRAAAALFPPGPAAVEPRRRAAEATSRKVSASNRSGGGPRRGSVSGRAQARAAEATDGGAERDRTVDLLNAMRIRGPGTTPDHSGCKENQWSGMVRGRPDSSSKAILNSILNSFFSEIDLAKAASLRWGSGNRPQQKLSTASALILKNPWRRRPPTGGTPPTAGH
jgi:hypothetical protein